MEQGQSPAGAGGGPLGAATIDAWLDEAQPGARLVYFSGYLAGAGLRCRELAERMKAEADRGMIHIFHQRRRGFDARAIPGFDYVAVRSSRPSPKAAKAAPRSLAEQAAAESRRLAGRSGR